MDEFEFKPWIDLTAETCNNMGISSRLEWWLADGLGGYAGGTVSGQLTRRYHGLLIAPLNHPLDRHLVFVKADANLIIGDQSYPLHSNQWQGGVIEPHGYSHLKRFHLDRGMPVWQFQTKGIDLVQRYCMPHGLPQINLSWQLIQNQTALKPLIRLGLIASLRDHHGVNRPNCFDLPTRLNGQNLYIQLSDRNQLCIQSETARFALQHDWIERFYHAIEDERGLECIDHHLRIGFVDIPLSMDQPNGILVGLNSVAGSITTEIAQEQQRIDHLKQTILPGIRRKVIPDWIEQLAVNTDQFIFERDDPDTPGETSVIAGYPWFGDWGRDTMISLPGLTLATGRLQLARKILLTYSEAVKEGMLPNVYNRQGKAEYNTVDAALWFICAWHAYFIASNDMESLQTALPKLDEIIDAYHQGTRFGIGMDMDDGLIHAGISGQQLTWMDARVDEQEVTPRHGKAVEINALWYNALLHMSDFAMALDKSPQKYHALSSQCLSGFQRFIRDDGLGLYDVIDGPDGYDKSIRPNQIFTLSLQHTPLEPEQQHAVIDVCGKHLLTPFGLRSLSPEDSRYAGTYIGSAAQRDGSYHQGPVWGWLLGHYAMAHWRVFNDPMAARNLLESMAYHMKDVGLGQISEIFDGDYPHAPRGAPAQAWSAACTLEAWWRLTLHAAGQ